MAEPVKKIKLLIVDDDSDILALLKENFEADAFKVFVAQDGSHAERLMESEVFDAIISDLVMPRLDGFAVAALARASRNNKNTRFFILTGKDVDEEDKRLASLGIAELLPKTLRVEEIVERVRRHMPLAKLGQQYDADVVKACVVAVRTVIEFYFGESPAIDKPFIKAEMLGYGYVSAIIPMMQPGEMQGSLSLSCHKNFMVILKKAVLADYAGELTNEMTCDMVGELCNQICGKLKLLLAKLEFAVEIGLPSVVVGEGHVIHHKCRNPPIAIPVKAKNCSFYVEFSMSGHMVKTAKRVGKREDMQDGMELFDEEPTKRTGSR